LGANGLPGHNSNVVKWLLWDGSNLVKAIIHQTTAIVASLVTIDWIGISIVPVDFPVFPANFSIIPLARSLEKEIADE
jgi:hypothetical protein